MSRLVESEYPGTAQLIFPCDCHNGDYLRLFWDDEDAGFRYLWIEQLHRPRLRSRLSAAWMMLRGRECRYSELILSEATVAALAAFLAEPVTP